MTAVLDKIYTADEAAERLRLTNRAVIKIARQYGLCSRRGRNYLFSEADLLELWEVMREKATEPRRPTVKAAPARDFFKDNFWHFSPSVSVDRREMEVLRSLNSQKVPHSHKQIERAGPRTIEFFLKQGFVMEVDRDEDGDSIVAITDKGREQIAVVDRWIDHRVKHGKSAGTWARHLKLKK
ncbi:helix-turn-helix domain-containing protein [Rhizobium sp. LC145]|uniref:helix-turn-helix domain-containing protein n=1 Tax=Rhizobium sp. LC145 TaxID=1120688 RepID=UPI00062A4D21|nr:helix-turn-helix domain-containing protein [Rhizobium sp. LC145]KKX33952.1 hypothetical protein YH62_01900 [Rhizobium sp. LC145]TKT42574.1 helix-turn-helix domain-containing protein [Rhizobiaceae bacterium LC148]